MSDVDVDEGPIFSAVSGSARQLFLLLRCISFADKAQVQILEEGLKFTVEEATVMEGMSTLTAAGRACSLTKSRVMLP
jgi:cell cycle checkpoint protein